MLSFRIWFLAQLFNAILSVITFKELGVIMIPFALVGGIPAIFLYHLFVWLLKLRSIKGKGALAAILVIFPASTCLCAYCTIKVLGDSAPLNEFLIIPAVATMLAVLCLSRSVLNVNANTAQ